MKPAGEINWDSVAVWIVAICMMIIVMQLAFAQNGVYPIHVVTHAGR